MFDSSDPKIVLVAIAIIVITYVLLSYFHPTLHLKEGFPVHPYYQNWYRYDLPPQPKAIPPGLTYGVNRDFRQPILGGGVYPSLMRGEWPGLEQGDFPNGLRYQPPHRRGWYIPAHQYLDMWQNGIGRYLPTECVVPSKISDYCINEKLAENGRLSDAIRTCTTPPSISEACPLLRN